MKFAVKFAPECVGKCADRLGLFAARYASIRARLSAQTEQVKTVANQVLATEAALKSLPISAQINAHNLADHLRSISGHLASAANYGAATAHRLSGKNGAGKEKQHQRNTLYTRGY